MPLLRRKPFTPIKPPENLTSEDEVFFNELTGEVFTDYDEFFERVILCNSLLWTCECTGRNGLTYKEARESEDNVREALKAIPDPTKRAVLELVHQTKRSRIADISEEIVDYLKCRFQDGEIVELKIGDEWKKCLVKKGFRINRSPTTPKSPKSSGKKGTPSKGQKSPVSPIDEDSSFWTSPSDVEYEIKVLQSDVSTSSTKVKGKKLRRKKGSLTRDLVRLLLRQTCKRTTPSSDDGYWVVEPHNITKYALEESRVAIGALSLETPLKFKQKRKRSSSQPDRTDDGRSPSKKKKTDNSKKSPKSNNDKEKAKEGKVKGKRKSDEVKKTKAKQDSKSPGKNKTLAQKQKEWKAGQKTNLFENSKVKELAEKERQKKKKVLQKEKERIQMKKDKEDEKQRKKIEREREKEKTSIMRKMESDFMKEWSKQKDDLILEDLKELPHTSKIKTRIQGDMFGDVLMVVEFLNIFGRFYDIKDTITQEITYDFVEKAVLEHDAEGVYYEILKFLIQTFLSTLKEENEEDNRDDESTHGTNSPEEQEEVETVQEEEEVKSGTLSSNATAAAAWPMLHQGMALEELTIDPFSLSEILRLHVLSSGVKIGGARNLWQKRGGFQFTDDPCVDFRHTEKSVMMSLHTSCVYDLTTQDKLKVLCVLCNQILTLTTTRDYIEDSVYKVKELKRKLRELQNKEQKRRKFQSAERWKKRMEECVKRREEIEKRKKEKEAKEEEGKSNGSPAAEDAKKNKKNRPKNLKKNPNESLQDENTEQSVSQESKTEPAIEDASKSASKKEEQTEEEKAEEQRIRDEYLTEEKALIDEISNYAVVCSEVPLGLDRTYTKYWALKHVDGLLVENDEEGRKLAGIVEEEDIDFYEDGFSKADTENNGGNVDTETKMDFPQVSLNDIKNSRHSRERLSQSLFTRYKCEFNEERSTLLTDCKPLSLIVDNVANGVDPVHVTNSSMDQWSVYTKSTELDELMAALNTRGIREDKFKTRLEKMTEKLRTSIGSCSLLQQWVPEPKPVRSKSTKGDDYVDKTLFKNMDDYLEANLCDQLLELEDRVWQAGLGVLKAENREKWREDLGDRINLLLIGHMEDEPGKVTANGADNSFNGNSVKMAQDEEKCGNIGGVSVKGGIDISPTNDHSTKPRINGNICTDEDMKMDVSENGIEVPTGPLKTLPLKFLEQNGLDGDSGSRCTTPVNVSIPMVNSQVKVMAKLLLQIQSGIEKKYLKPPLGEDEDTKKERIREMIEAARADFNGSSNNTKSEQRRSSKKEASADLKSETEAGRNDDNESVTSSEDLKKERTCLERWETSLQTATNFSQIFIHLNTLDRSIMWDKSVLNARCRLCRKKGDAEKMLLCDGCDRGFHMYCLKPPVKRIPQGDWFCVDCRPKEQRRTARMRKRPPKLEEFVNEEPSEEEDDDDEDEDADSEDDEESDEDESSDEEPVDQHSDFCAVCDMGGDLLCCDSCSRAYHINCTYPPIRKAPKGDWSCQVCSGADSDLPKARRVSTLERQREKEQTALAKELSRKESKTAAASKASVSQKNDKNGSTRGPGRPKKDKKRGYSSPGPVRSGRPPKKLKSDVKNSENKPKKQPTKSDRKSIGDPTAHNSRRQSDAFGRYERRICSKVLEELLASDDAEPFLMPVDVRVVKDYLDFIDSPMDLSTIKRNLNNGVYDSLDKFIADVRLIFLNCEAYNPPRSATARTGSRFSMYFEQRLQELDLAVK